jgi:hypothetical protein
VPSGSRLLRLGDLRPHVQNTADAMRALGAYVFSPRDRLRSSAAGGLIQHLSGKPLVARDALRARFPSRHSSRELDPVTQTPRPEDRSGSEPAHHR